MQERQLRMPVVNAENKPYFLAAAQGKLLIKHCSDCHQYHFYPRVICPHCGSFNTQWTESKGSGSVYSFSVMHAAQIPYTVAYVTLDEGVILLTNLVGADVQSWCIGQRVKVAFRHTDGDVVVPVFTHAEQ